jgi:UDP-N-acetylglucosamine 2-epimerase (non-hydrolysing)
MAEYLFAPTKLAASHLIAEGRRSDRVFVTGNTAIDALKYTFRNDFSHEILDFAAGRRLILITAHRRENMENLRGMFRGILRALDKAEDICAVYPMHPNPEIRRIAHEILGNNERIRLCAPLDMLDFHNILARTYIAVTDSGGIQEEAPYFGVPTLVMRGTTERPEAQEAGAAMLIGNSEASVCEGMRNVISNAEIYRAMSRAGNPYGDGCASGRIADIIERAKL